MLQNQLKADPAIKALIEYAAEAPSIICEEGYWDDSESACADGMNQAKSEAAALIREALTALGIDPPNGVEVCPECFRDDSDGHSHQCSREGQDEEDEPEGVFAVRVGTPGDATGTIGKPHFPTYDEAEEFAQACRRPGKFWACVEQLEDADGNPVAPVEVSDAARSTLHMR